MMPLVVDASAAAAWLLRSQAGPRSDAFLERTGEFVLLAPDIFAWETGNLLRLFAARGALDLDEAFEVLDALSITVAEPRAPSEVYDLARFAQSIELTLFDAAYMALAVELEAELVSRDANLLTVAQAHAIPCHDIRDVS